MKGICLDFNSPITRPEVIPRLLFTGVKDSVPFAIRQEKDILESVYEAM